MRVNNINTNKAKEELKSCPKIVRDYVFALERALERQQELTKKAIDKLKNS